MDDEKLISLVVPVFNVEDYLQRCVESLIAQTYKNIEIILVDDGATDKSGEMCDQLALIDRRIVTFHKPNGGLSDARNYGVDKAKGDYIIFVESDDYVMPQYVEHLWELKEQFQADIAINRVIRVQEGRKHTSKCEDYQSFCCNSRQALIEVYTGRHVGWEAYAKIYPKELLLKVPSPSGVQQDCASMYKIIAECRKIAIGNYEDYQYITREGSILKSRLSPKHFRVFEICEEFDDFIRGYDPTLRFLTSVLYQRQVIQMLNLQEMDENSYNEIFKRYRGRFRKDAFSIMLNNQLSWQTKAYRILLCSTPKVYRTVVKKATS